MARYVDGFLLTVPKKNLPAYRKMAAKAGKVWREHGALQFVEAVIDDVPNSFGVPFSKAAKARPGEVVMFSFIVYKSRADRDRINKKVMADPRLQDAPDAMPFDHTRMSWGGFKTLVDL
jgi:uncharacterized protein YbaA (DUF1428 family)